MQYDLEDRVSKFGSEIIMLCKQLDPYSPINSPLIKQLIRSGTSIGANYMEANQASSKRDFINKIKIAQKEANETKHWLRMIATATPEHSAKCQNLWSEAHELVLILATIAKKSRNKIV
ncbi:MAG: four helix bundle protein [Candidatus Buchananbacteria bacterium]|nr:four helix bundle protein [Candidatus Buchananbacteria bacterium]